MTVLTRSVTSLSRRDLLIGLAIGLVALGVTFTNPQKGGMLLVMAAAGVVVAMLALRSPAVAILLLLGCSFGREMVKSLPSDPLLLATYGLMISTALAWRRGRYDYRRYRIGIPELLMALYLLWNIGSMILPHEYDGSDVWRFIVKGTVLPLLLYLVGRFAFDTERSLRALLWVVAGFTVYATINAIAQIHGPSFLVYPKVTITESGWKERAVGVFNQPVVNGILLAVGFLVLFYLAQDPTLRARTKALLYVAAGGAAYAIQLTQTRSALLGLVLVLVFGAVFAKGWRSPFVISLLLGAAAVAVNYKKFFSSDRAAGGVGSGYELIDRLNIAATMIRAINEHPFVGVGLTRFVMYNTDHHVTWAPNLPWDNGYGQVPHETDLGIAAETGVLGTILWWGVLATILIAVGMAFRKLPAGEFFGRKFAILGVAAAVVWVSNETTVDMRLLDFANALPFLLMGVTVGLRERWDQLGRLTVTDDRAPGLPASRRPLESPNTIGLRLPWLGSQSPGSSSQQNAQPRAPEPVS